LDIPAGHAAFATVVLNMAGKMKTAATAKFLCQA
jgi:hypothetical protein